MLSPTSLRNRLQDSSDLMDKGYLQQMPDWIESELDELRNLGYGDPERLLADWQERNKQFSISLPKRNMSWPE